MARAERAAGRSEDEFRLGLIYPDEDLTTLILAASEATTTPVSVLLEGFGAYLAPVLLRIYTPLVEPEWRTLDVIEHTEQSIHSAVRARMPGAAPPALVSRRISADEVEISYSSERRLCFVAKGIARGLADHFGEHITISESECMHLSAPGCLMSFRTSAT